MGHLLMYSREKENYLIHLKEVFFSFEGGRAVCISKEVLLNSRCVGNFGYDGQSRSNFRQSGQDRSRLTMDEAKMSYVAPHINRVSTIIPNENKKNRVSRLH